jgi:cytochrome c peroxidase
MKSISTLIGVIALGVFNASAAQVLSPGEQLGKSIFFDPGLSINGNQSCAVCHGPEVGWTGPIASINTGGAVYEGSIPGRFGNRKPPSSAYATDSPVLHPDKKGDFTGGNFWDGRATGEKLGNPAADQAQGPFVNPLEQAAPDPACIVYKVCMAGYPVSFEDVWGAGTCAIVWPADVNVVCATVGGFVDLSAADRAQAAQNYDSIALSIAAFEGSPESNVFSSKFDAYLAGEADLTRQEKTGLNLFKGKGKCARCHTLKGNSKGEPLLTDFTYDNLGLPRNPDNPFYLQLAFNPAGIDWIDLGLGGFLESRIDYQPYAAANLGKQKVPTLRNVDKRPDPGFPKAYGHNGYFKSLKGIVHFYNTRDVKPVCADLFTTEADALAQGCWPEPEVVANVNTKELGDLKLSNGEEDAIVAFLKTLSDGYSSP